MKNLADKYIALAESQQQQMEDFARLSGIVRGNMSLGSPAVMINQNVPGDYPTGSMVGNIGLTVTRQVIPGFGLIPRNLPVVLGSAFSFADFFNFISRKIIASAGIIVNVFPDINNNALVFRFTDGVGGGEDLILSGGNYSLYGLIQGLYNVKATIEKLRISLPTEDNSRLNAWQRDGLKLATLSWLSSFNDNPITVSRAPGQFNRAIYDNNIPIEISNSQSVAVFIPALPSLDVSEVTDITLYFSKIQRI
jgi:hypothetical protein